MLDLVKRVRSWPDKPDLELFEPFGLFLSELSRLLVEHHPTGLIFVAALRNVHDLDRPSSIKCPNHLEVLAVGRFNYPYSMIERIASLSAQLVQRTGILPLIKAVHPSDIDDSLVNSLEAFGVILYKNRKKRGDNMPDTELRAPVGKTRVVGVDLFDHGDYLVGDFDTPEEAFRTADDHNKSRRGSMDDVYYVYNDRGRYIRGNEAVGQRISP